MKKINSYFIYFSLILSIFICGCAAGKVSILKDIKISGEKVIAIDSPNDPWVETISKMISENGFEVITTGKLETRFILSIDASAPTGPLFRCFGGGWNFNYYTATVYDLIEKENIASVKGTGYSDFCPPMAGNIFAKTAKMVNDLWSPNGEREQYYVHKIDDSEGAKAVWEIIKDSNEERKYIEFINKFPKSSLVVAAQFKIDNLQKDKQKTVKKKNDLKTKAVVVPIGTIGSVSNSQKNIILNKFLDELSNNYDLVSDRELERAEMQATQEFQQEDCTKDQCLRRIKEILDVDNLFYLQMIREDSDTQVSLTLVSDRKIVKTDFCENCKTQSLIKLVSKLYKELESKR